jgi:hypothetical protein
MTVLHRPGHARLHRQNERKTSAYAFVPHQTHFGELCGFADDIVAPGQGFGMHPHRDMEISTIMLAGAQIHEDSTGREQLLDSSAVQTMSAGTGMSHSEMNASADEPFHSFQIWIYPRHVGVTPRYERFVYRPEDKHNRILLALSPDGRDGSAHIGQEAFLSVAQFGSGHTTSYAMHLPGHGVYVHCATGEVLVSGHRLGAGDALGVYDADECAIEASAHADLVFVEVPMVRGVRV